MPLDYNEFAEKIKAKYPEYKDVDNYTLASKMVEKYPEYAPQVDLKKKDPTGGVSASGTGSSASSDGEIFTGYPGKEKKPYKFKDGKWYEETVVSSGKDAPNTTIKTKYSQITDPNRIKNLNYQFKKDASLSQQEQVFSNYDEEKKDNLYRINNNQWERKTPGGKFVPIKNEGSINALNRRYGQSVGTKIVPTTTLPPKNFKEITSSFVGQTEEKAIDYLTKNYSKYGFTFEEEGAFAIDRIRVKTQDGSKEEVFEFDEKNPEQAAKLKAFLEENATKAYSKTYYDAVGTLRKLEYADPKTGQRTSWDAKDPEKAPINVGKKIIDQDFQNQFKKLSFEEQKELIQNHIVGVDLPTKYVQEFYKTPAYQDYKKKKSEANKTYEQKLNDLYDQYNYAKETKDPNKIKEAKNRINSYLTDEVIQDNVKNYDMQLNDLQKTAENIQSDIKAYDLEVAKFNQLAKSGSLTQEEYNEQKSLIDNKAEDIETRRQKLKTQRDQIIASQSKLNFVAGKYIAAKEKEGGTAGYLLNKVLSGVSMVVAEPFAYQAALGKDKYDELSPEEKAYYKSLKYNGKNLTKQQIENLLDNQAILQAKEDAKASIIKAVGSEGTTLEYMKSGDRGWFTQAIGGVLESLPAMASGVGGKATSFVGLAAQAYSGIEEEMLSDPDFQYTSAADRALIAIPYAAAMGVLENVGLNNLVKGDSFAGKVLMGVALKAAKKLGANATVDALEKIAEKEVQSMLAKGLIKITQAGIAEFETGATQSLVLDKGWKDVANWWMSQDLTEEQKKNLTKGEFFETPDGFKETAFKVFEDGLAEMVGGKAMSTVGVISERLIRGNISLYSEDDLKFLKNVATDTEFKKLMVANLKTQMIRGNITKSEANAQLDAVNRIDGIISSMPEQLSDRDRMNAFNLIVERDRLQQEIDKSDPALVTSQKERVAEINNQLDKISKDAIQKQAAGEVPVQPGTEISGEMAQREPETGLEEATQKGKEEVAQYIADMGAEARLGATINPIMEKMSNAEFINDNDIDTAIEAIFNEVEQLEKSDQYSPETKAAMSEKLLNIADKLDNYEFRTKTETVATTKAGAASTTRRTSEAVQKIRAEKYFNGVEAEVNGQQVTLSDNNGRVEAAMPNGEVIVIDTPTMEINEDGFEFDDNGALQAVVVSDRLGNTVKLTGEQALDFAIRDRENKLGVVEQAEFETVYQQVEKKYIKEGKAEPAQVVEEETQAEEAPAEEVQVEEEAPKEKVNTEDNLITEKNAKLVSVKFKRNPIVRAALNIMKALPGVKIYLHENTDQYASALADRTGESKQSITKENSAGSYIDGEIHIDMTKADMVTLLHEAVHHAFAALGVSENLFIDLAKGLRPLITDKARLAELDAFIESYDGDELKAEEFMAQLGGILADNREELTVSKLTQFKALINRLMKKIGLGVIFKASATTKEAADLINAITFGLSTGSKISDQVVGKTGKAKFQADFSDSLSKLTFVYDKNRDNFKKLEKEGYITYDKKISDFAGKYMLLHQPDAAFSGMIYKNGELLVEGKGGVYYPIKFHKDGYFWASTSSVVDKMADDLNEVLEQNGGTIYMALTSAPYDKLMSSTTMANAILDFFSSKAFDKNFKINNAQLKKALIESANDVKVKKTKNKKGEEKLTNVGLDLKLKSSSSIDEIKSNIRTKLNPDNSSFADRKNFSLELIKLMANEIKSNPEAVQQFGKLFSEGIQNKYFKGVTKTGKISISASNMVQAISEMFTEPLLKEGVDRERGGQVYAVIELNGRVKPTDSDKHESYPKTLQSDSDSKVKMHILQDRELWSDVFEDFEDGSDITSKDRAIKIFPTTGVSVRGLRVKGGASARKKQLIGQNAYLSKNVKDNLAVAKKMETAKQSVKDIRIATGWEKGVDGKWRYEIEDVKVNNRLKDVIANTLKTKTKSTPMYLGDMIDNSTPLLTAYPSLDKAVVIVDIQINKNSDIQGAYGLIDIDGKNVDIIFLKANKNIDSVESTLIHELQHAIQEREGFAKGTNIKETFSQEIALNRAVKLTEAEQKALDRNIFFLSRGIDDVNKMYEYFVQYIKDTLTSEENRNYVIKRLGGEKNLDLANDYVIEYLKENEVPSVRDQKSIIKMFEAKKSFDQVSGNLGYTSTAGEVEARNVQARRKMSAKERLNTLLSETENIPRSRQIIDGKIARKKQLINKELSKASGTTQVATTTGSYAKVATSLKNKRITGDVLDYGAGLGLGTDAMSDVLNRNVDSFEINTERWKGRRKPTYTNAEDIDKKYEAVVSLNVINVVPKDIRDFIIEDIFSKLKNGGVAYVSSRGFSGDIANAKNFELGPEDKSYIIKRSQGGKTIDVFQKGFDGDELVEYVQDLLGDKAVVEKDNSFGNKGVIITKIKEDGTKLAPNGKPSNLTDKQWEQVRTPNFKSWFGFWDLVVNNLSKSYDNEDVRNTSKAIKNGDKDAINKAAKFLAKQVGKDDILIPMPSRTGKATDSHSLMLAEAISKISGSKIYDGLRGKERPSLYELKQKGISIEDIDLGFYLDGNLPTSNKYFIVDNVIGTGLSMANAQKVIEGNSEPLVYAVDERNVSKVVDENGEPLVVYHGAQSMEQIEEFDPTIQARNPRSNAVKGGNWFTNNVKNAKTFGNQVYNLFLNIKNPLVVDIQKTEFTKMSELSQYIESKMRNDSSIDGIVYQNFTDKILSDNYQTFESNQVKSATDNVGTFDKNSKKIKFQKAPKILGVKPTVVIVNDEQKALVDQIKLEVRAQREQKKAHKQVLADISARVTALKSKGNISVKQFDFIMKKLKGLNFDNKQKVSEFIDYVSRALANAEYIDNVQKAKRMTKAIAGKLKGRPNPFAVVAKMFTSLDAEYVENIVDHIAVAQMIMDGVKSSSTRGGKLTLKQEPDLQVIAEYIDAEQQRQTQRLFKNLQARYENITGKPSTNLPAETMLAELQALKPDVDNSAEILDQIDLQLAAYSQLIDEDTPQVIIDAINIDTEEFGIADSIKVLDALDTYFANGVTSGIESLMGAYQGIMNAKKFKFKSKPMRVAASEWLGRTRLGTFAGFSRILERKFRSVEKSNSYQKASGINGIVVGANKADFEASFKQSEYIKKFYKIKGFKSNENIYERGVIADLIRTNPGIDQDAEFQRLINILIDSKDMLLQSTDNVKVEMGKLYDKVFKKLGLYNANVTLESVLAKAEKSNIDAVNFAVDMFAEKYDQLSDTAMGVYNIMLGQDINYTPKTYVNIKGIGSKDSDPLSGEDVFGLGNISNSGFNRNEAGVLMPITRPKDLKSNGKYIDLNFDNNMFRSYRLALTDTYTAKSIRQLNSFYNSRENESIIGSEKDFDIIKAALSDYINDIKGKNLIDKNLLKGIDKFQNMLSTFGAVRALAGIGQFASQFSSGMSNTIVNAGEHMRPSDLTKKAFDFMDRSGQPIANVGENDILISLSNLDKSIERATIGKSFAEVGLDEFAKFNAKAFKILVSNPDAAARRLAWMAYYRKYVIKNKLGPIDFNAEPNADAAAYAQSMVDRSMDTTDARVRGEIYRSKNTYAKIIKSMLLPFSSFGMNQRTRMWGDLTKIVTGDFDMDTARSLASIAAEIYVYNVIRFQMARLVLYAAMNLLGYDDDEQDELIEKLKKNMLSSSWSKAVVDILSPLALADNMILKLSNYFMSETGVGAPEKSEVDEYIDEENRIRELKNQDPLNAEQEKKKREEFIEKNSMNFYISDEANFGTLGIQWEKMSEAYDIYKAMKTGEFTDDQNRTAYLDDEGMEKIKGVAILKTIGVVAPVREVDQVANKSFSLLKKSNRMSEKVRDMSAEIKKKYGKLDPVLEKLAEKKKKMSTIDDEMDFIKTTLESNNKTALTEDQKIEYAKILEYIPRPTEEMLLAIKANKTADQILKK